MKTDELMREYARKGIEAEIERLQQALRALGGVRAAELPPVAQLPQRPGRRPMTPAARRALSRRMKAMWAAKRKAKA